MSNSHDRTKLSMFFSDFMDALSDYTCGHYSTDGFREHMNEIHDIYKYYQTTEIMYKATIQRLTECVRFIEANGTTERQTRWVNQELKLIKHPPKIIF